MTETQASEPLKSIAARVTRLTFSTSTRIRATNTPFVDGVRVVSNRTYDIIDWYCPNGTSLSMTILAERKSTRGHTHADQSEVYYFLSADDARMIVGEEEYSVRDGDVVFVKEGLFHRVLNDGPKPCRFFAIFTGRPRRPALT